MARTTNNKINGTSRVKAEPLQKDAGDELVVPAEQIISDTGAANADGIALLLHPDFDVIAFEERAWLLEPVVAQWAKYAAEDTYNVVDARLELRLPHMFKSEKERETACDLTGTQFLLRSGVPYAAIVMDLVDERGVGGEESFFAAPELIHKGEAAVREKMRSRATDMMQEAADLIVQAQRMRAAAEAPLEVSWPSFWQEEAAPAGKRAA